MQVRVQITQFKFLSLWYLLTQNKIKNEKISLLNKLKISKNSVNTLQNKINKNEKNKEQLEKELKSQEKFFKNQIDAKLTFC